FEQTTTAASTMGRGKFKGKPTGRRQFSTPEDILGGTSRPRTFRQRKMKGTQGIIEIDNPNVVKKQNLKAKDIDLDKTTELTRREREELEKQRSHERYMKLQEQGKTEQAKKDLGKF
uniref:Casein kinase substrate phosphoprotein PP28 domain-containing protein n=1 Tax=Chenopodium quinoa TaxID=63459 RepID=A0A803LLQ2_CHEQI